jgi:hypothetical protein
LVLGVSGDLGICADLQSSVFVLGNIVVVVLTSSSNEEHDWEKRISKSRSEMNKSAVCHQINFKINNRNGKFAKKGNQSSKFMKLFNISVLAILRCVCRYLPSL